MKQALDLQRIIAESVTAALAGVVQTAGKSPASVVVAPAATAVAAVPLPLPLLPAWMNPGGISEPASAAPVARSWTVVARVYSQTGRPYIVFAAKKLDGASFETSIPEDLARSLGSGLKIPADLQTRPAKARAAKRQRRK